MAGEAVLQAHGQMGKIWDEREAILKIDLQFHPINLNSNLKL